MSAAEWETMVGILDEAQRQPVGLSAPIPADTPLNIKFLCTQAYSRGILATKQPGIFGPEFSDSASDSQKLVLSTYFALALGTNANNSSQNTNVPKNHNPDEYHGEKSKYKAFVSQLALAFGTNEAHFRTDKSKINYAASFLRGSAFDWLQPFIDDIGGEIAFSTYSDFLAGLRAGFADPDTYATAERDLEELTQKSSCSAYYSQFVALLSQLKWTEDAVKIHYFRRGLKDGIKDRLVGRDLPTTISEFAALCIKLDNQIEARAREKKYTTTKPIQNQIINPAQKPKNPLKSERESRSDTSNPQLAVGDPMELDSASRKAYRKANNLCTYCGAAGHWVRNCQKAQSKKGRIASASLDTNEDSENPSALYHTKNEEN